MVANSAGKKVIAATDSAHETSPRDQWRAWFTDAQGNYRWSRRGWQTEAEATAYGRRVVERWRRIYANRPR